MEKDKTLGNAHTGHFRLQALSILLLLPACMLLFCSLGVCSTDSDSRTFRERLGLPQEPKPLLEQILARDEFKQQESRSLTDRLRELVREMIRRVLEWIVKHLPKGTWLSFDSTKWDAVWNVLSALLIGTAVVLFVWFGKRVADFILTRAGRKSAIPSHGAPEPVMSLVSNEARKLALKKAEEGNYPQALIYLFRFVLLWLDERGRLPLHPGKTNREVLQGLARGEPLRPVLGEMVVAFNRVKYGMAPCEKHDYERFLALCHTVEEETRQKRR